MREKTMFFWDRNRRKRGGKTRQFKATGHWVRNCRENLGLWVDEDLIGAALSPREGKTGWSERRRGVGGLAWTCRLGSPG